MSSRPPIPRRSVPVPQRNDDGPTVPPPIPRRRLTEPDDQHLARLLARRPPPPPKRPSVPPPLNISSKPLLSPSVPPPPPPPPISCLSCRSFHLVDAHAAQFPRESVSSIDELAHNLGEPYTKDIDKARVIFTWLHLNVAYNTRDFFAGTVQATSPEETLISGLAVCEGYAGLFEALADRMGLQAHVVSGHGKGLGYQPLRENDPIPEFSSNHAWNCVMIDQEWRLIDPCWGAGAVNGSVYEPELNETWFIADPSEFGRRHYPEDPSFLLTPEQISWEEYISTQDGPTITGVFSQYGLRPMSIQPSCKFVPERTHIKFAFGKRCEHMSTADADNYVFVIKTGPSDFTPLEFDKAENQWSATVFTPRSGDVTIFAVDTVNQVDALGLGVGNYKKQRGKKAMSFKGLAIWTVVHL